MPLYSAPSCLRKFIRIAFFIEWIALCSNVSVKSKLKHPPRAYPGHLTCFPVREGGNLMNLVFPGAGNLITTHRGGEFDR